MKTNVVIKKEQGEVIKICRNHDEFKKELHIYNKNLSFVPNLLDHNKSNTLIIEYIDGTLLIKEENPDFYALGKLFAQLHQVERQGDRCICFYDSTPKNIIRSLHNNQYYMLDFSEWEFDYPEADLIHFLLFFASLQSKEDFKSSLNNLIKGYRESATLNPIQWDMLVAEQISRFDSRRKKFNKYDSNEHPDIKANRELIEKISWLK